MKETPAEAIRNSILSSRFKITKEEQGITVKGNEKEPRLLYVMHVEHEDENPHNRIKKTLQTALKFMEATHPKVEVEITSTSKRTAEIKFKQKTRS